MQSVSLGRTRLFVYEDGAALTGGLAETLVELSAACVSERGRFALALSGGSTPKALYRLLAEDRFSKRMPWASTHLFWGDERCVDPDHPDSNFKMVDDALIKSVPIPSTNVHGFTGQGDDPARAAAAYEEGLRAFFALNGDDLPQFDLILLGLGPDGHTASLFPGTTALLERRRLVVPVYVDRLATWRVTLTLPVLNNGRHVAFMVAGADKQPMVTRVLSGEGPPLPAQLIDPAGTLSWYLDRAAAAGLAELEPAAEGRA